MKIIRTVLLIVVGLYNILAYSQDASRDLDKDKTLYLVGYAHLDSQWRWDYETTINDYIKDTLDKNFELFEKYPQYVFNFTGSARYAMMKEYYPEKYEQLKKYIADGRWFVSGSSVDECDVLIISPESLLRQILYGNAYFRKEFNKESCDFMLPDCFGFPSYLPSVFSHAGLIGFSTQKLSWGSVVGIPFNVGVWEGPDGKSILAALNPGSYTSKIEERQDISEEWTKRIEENGTLTGVYADYRYYGVGDRGGALRETDVQMAIASLNNPDSKISVILASSAQFYKDITPQQEARLPKYSGELMLTEHSSGSTTSQSYMKRSNRKNEQLADAAERACTAAYWFGRKYPGDEIHNSWLRVLGSQMHDILPGTALPKAYEYAWNDQIIAANGFASAMTESIRGISGLMDTRVKGQAIVVYNPLAIERQDLASAKVRFTAGVPEYVSVYNNKGRQVPSQVISRKDNEIEVIFLADLPSVGFVVYDVRPSSKPCTISTKLKAQGNTIENAYYRVTIDNAGDIASIYDKQNQRQLLKEPARLEFLRGTPANWPAWNMDWRERALPRIGVVDGQAEIKIVENGPARIAIEVKRTARDSIFIQKICLSAGDCGKRVEVYNDVDWQTSACVLKAAFPLTVQNQVATYTQGLGTIQRGNNNPRQFEMLSHEWFDLTDSTGDYGVSILEDCKFGSDKPSDDTVRLTLLYTPGSEHKDYHDQLTQDWGRHNFVYAIYGHKGPWQYNGTEFQGRRLNQPLITFMADRHKGKLKEYSFMQLNTQQVDVRAIKKAQDGDLIVVRLQELCGKDAKGVTLSLGEGIDCGFEIDGQEKQIGPANINDGRLELDMHRNAIRSFALKLAPAPYTSANPAFTNVALDCSVNAFSYDKQPIGKAFGLENKSMPAEMIPASIVSGGIEFNVAANPGQYSALSCMGQTIALPQGEHNYVYILAAADNDIKSSIQIGGSVCDFSVQSWTGFVGQYDNRVWDKEFGKEDYKCNGTVTEIKKGYIKRDPIAWFCTHRHNSLGENEAYKFSYIFRYGFEVPGTASTITLPNEPAIKIFAVSAVKDLAAVQPACDLYDNFDNRENIVLRGKQKSGSNE